MNKRKDRDFLANRKKIVGKKKPEDLSSPVLLLQQNPSKLADVAFLHVASCDWSLKQGIRTPNFDAGHLIKWLLSSYIMLLTDKLFTSSIAAAAVLSSDPRVVDPSRVVSWAEPNSSPRDLTLPD